MRDYGRWANPILISLLVSCCALAARADSHETEAGAPRIAVISAVDTPRHEGFALAVHVPSDRACLELAQNLASQVGTVVSVVCSDSASGRTVLAAECGYASEENAPEVGRYSRGWAHTRDPYLICVRPPRQRFPARRILPDLEAFRR
jgi:hypothetical protein